MRAREFIIENRTLTEGVGLSNRKLGDVFVSKTSDDKMSFEDIQFWPPTGGYYEGAEYVEMIEQLEDQFKSNNLTWTNRPLTKGGFGVATFVDENGKEVSFGKYFKQINAVPTKNAWHNQTGIPGWGFGGKAVRKNDSGMMPSQVLTNFDNLTPSNVIEQVSAKFGKEHPLTILTQEVALGVNFPIRIAEIPDIDFEAFRDYFTEILHPLALKSSTYTGNANEAEEIFLTKGGFQKALITFSTSKTEGLSDSTLVNDSGERLQISSKAGTAGTGASAGIKNLNDSLNEMRKTNLPDKFYKDNAGAINVIETISNNSAYEGPIALGLKYKIINQKEANLIRELRKLSAMGHESYESVRDGSYLTKNLQKLYLEITPQNPKAANAYDAMTSGLAKTVAHEVNKNSDFARAAAAILNNSALVQVYTKAKRTGTEWIITDFNTKFPSSAVTDVALDPKNYAATKNNGKFAFKIGKDGARAEQPAKMAGKAKRKTKEQNKADARKSELAQKRADFKSGKI